MARYFVTLSWETTNTITYSGERHTKPAAFRLLWRYAYDELKSCAKLDTQAAWTVKGMVDDWEARGLKPGAIYTGLVSNTGSRITIQRLCYLGKGKYEA